MGDNRYIVIGLIFLSVVSIYSIFWPIISHDMENFLIPWMSELVIEGPVGAFAEPFSNYTPPYLYLLSIASVFNGFFTALTLIKSVSVLSAIFLSLSLYYLFTLFEVKRQIEAAAWSLMLPGVVLNVAWLAQCDPLWVAPCVMAVAAAVKGRSLEMVIWAGVAFSIKAQSAFIAPFIFLVLLHKRSSIYLWLVPPLIYAAAMLPAWLVGWPADELVMVYIKQALWRPSFIGNAPNPWTYIATIAPENGWRYARVGYVATLAAIGAYIWALRYHILSPRMMLAAATLSVTLVPYILPRMHERYFMLADVLSFAFAAICPSFRTVTIAALINAGSALSILSYIIASDVPTLVGGLLVTVALLMLLAELVPEQEQAAAMQATN